MADEAGASAGDFAAGCATQVADNEKASGNARGK